jgi:xylan 1,4-beta-xylosidase
MYSSYTAASFARIHDLAERTGVNIEGVLTWAFEFEDQPYFAGFRSLASNGIDKPVLNVFRMFAKMSGQRLAVSCDAEIPLETILREGVRSRPDVSALASLDERKLCVMLWHYHDDDVPGPEAEVELELADLPLREGTMRLEHFRIDEDHSNAYAVWKRMGLTVAPTQEEYATLERAGQLQTLGEPASLQVKDGKTVLKTKLPVQAVSLLVFTW